MWISKEDAAEALNQSLSTAKRNIRNGEYKIRKIPSKKNKDKTITMIDFFSLPLEAQERYLKNNDSSQNSNDNPGQDQDILNLLHESRELSENQLHEILNRLNAVKEMESILESKTHGAKTEAVSRLSQKAGIPVRSLYRYYSKYKECRNNGGLIAAFSDSRDAKKGKHYSADQQTIDHIKYIFLQEDRPRMMQVYRRIKAWCKENSKTVPSYPTVTRIIKDIPESAKVLHRRGLKEWRHKAMPKTRRSYKDLVPNEIWSGDHHELDLFIQYKGKAVRPWLTVWQDLATRAITGFNINLQPNSQTIGLALRHAILPKENKDYYMHGVPSQVLIDNGKDYRSHHLNGTIKNFKVDFDIHTKGVFADLGITPRYCKPYSPWAKPPERFFGTLTDQLVKTLAGWCGNKPENRPEKLILELKNMHLLTLHQLNEIIENWIVYRYHRNKHAGADMGNRSPNEVWADRIGAVKVPSERALDILLMKVESRTVQPYGITFMGKDNIYWNDRLIPYIGHRVTIRYSPDKIGELLVFDDRKFICRATNDKLLTYNASEKDLKEVAKRQKKAKKLMQDYRIELQERSITPDPVERVLIKQDHDISVQEKIAKKKKRVAMISEMERISCDVLAQKKKEEELPEILVWPDQFEKREKLKAKGGGKI